MLNIDSQPFAWPKLLKPVGEGSFDKEPFEPWWERHCHQFPRLDSRILEQWVHRHWCYSPYAFLNLKKLTYSLETWRSSEIIDNVYIAGWELNPDFDYDVFSRNNEFGGHPTSKALDAAGTWDYPILVLSTPNGVLDRGNALTDVRFLLIEGHSRMRYMNALRVKGRVNDEHELFVLHLEET